MGYKEGVVHLSSSDGARLEIPEAKLAQEDIIYLRSQDMYEKARSRRRWSVVGKVLRAFKIR